MTTPDPTLAARLAELRAKATDDDLNGHGHYFGDCGDLTQCSHGDCGYFQNRHDGPFLAALWNAYRSGQLITTAEADARVKAAVLAEREAILAEVDGIRTIYAPIGSKEWSLLSRVRATIRWRGINL